VVVKIENPQVCEIFSRTLQQPAVLSETIHWQEISGSMYLDTLDASQSYFPKEIEATSGIPALCEILMINVKEKI
jgi:hypothetical protein